MKTFTEPRWYCPIHDRWYSKPLWTFGPKAEPFHLGCGKPLVKAVVAAWEPREVSA
jgi:hypothetical protein